MRIIFLCGNNDERAEMVSGLNALGFVALGVPDSASLYLELLRSPTDSVVIDLDTGSKEALRVATHLRSYESTQDLGIIALGVSGDANFRIEALSNGADIYLAKPVDVRELAAYLKNIERRRRHIEVKFESVCWRFLQSEWRLVAPSGAQISLSHLENSFVHIVAKNAGKPVRRRDIISTAFGKDPLSYDNRRLEAVVSRLRRKVHRAYPLSQPIRVVHSIGYVFTDAIVCA